VADQTSSSITINASPEAILAVISDLESYPAWTDAISKVVIDEPGKAGPAKATFSMSANGMSDEYTLNYSWKPDGVSWELAAPSTLQKSQQGSYQLTAAGDATKVDYFLTMEIKIPMIGMLKRKFQKRITDTALKELKNRVESLG
jgi:ribosome-associated toxin RatA of RatAB toxin-antitoxin module